MEADCNPPLDIATNTVFHSPVVTCVGGDGGGVIGNVPSRSTPNPTAGNSSPRAALTYPVSMPSMGPVVTSWNRISNIVFEAIKRSPRFEAPFGNGIGDCLQSAAAS